MALETTSVGSLPKPGYLRRARAKFDRGEITREQLRELAERSTAAWIRFQEEIGIDILVDGEQYRGDMVAYFAENLDGAEISGLVRSYGNRYYKKPIVVDELRREGPITVGWWKFAQGLTDKPVKGMLTGPYTMMDWAFNEYYPSREECALAFAQVVREEARDLVAAGAKVVQIDEPALSTRDDELPLVVDALGRVTKGLGVKTITHTCYGNYEKTYPGLLDLPVDQIDLEMSNSGLDLLALFRKHPFTKELAFGVIDVHNHAIETPQQVEDRLREALEVVPPERLYVDPDCGLKTRTPDEAREKLRAMVRGRDAVRATLSGEVPGITV